MFFVDNKLRCIKSQAINFNKRKHIDKSDGFKEEETHPMVHGSEPERIRGICIVPNLWKFKSSMPSAVKHGISQRMCDPRNNSADPRSGALGVRLKFCFPR